MLTEIAKAIGDAANQLNEGLTAAARVGLEVSVEQIMFNNIGVGEAPAVYIKIRRPIYVGDN